MHIDIVEWEKTSHELWEEQQLDKKNKGNSDGQKRDDNLEVHI